MAKRRTFQPRPDNVWHTSGRAPDTTIVQAIRQRLQHEPFQHSREFTTEEDAWLWGFDAAWSTPDGDRIRARLQVQPDWKAMRRRGLTLETVEQSSSSITVAWRLTAEADAPWNLEWPSPMDMLGCARTMDWVYGRLPLDDVSIRASPTAEELRTAFAELAKASWYIPVLTHDKRPLEDVDVKQEPILVSFLPPSLRGRVVEVRLFGDQDRIVNAPGVLPDSKLRLARGWSLILPSSPRQEAWSLADYAVRRPPGGTMEQLLKETAEAVTRYAALQPHYCRTTRECVEDLRERWVLPEIEVAPKRILHERDQALECLRTVERQLAEAQAETAAERKAAEEARKAREAAEARLQELSESPVLEQARQAMEQAEEAWAAQERAEAELDRRTGEVAYLRRRLAQAPGGSYDEPVPQAPEGPRSWEELFELAGDLLDRVVILDSARQPALSLRGTPGEASTLRKAWEALEAYQAYAEATSEQPAEVLPHMTAYLQWPEAQVVFPLSRYAAGENSALRRHPKFTVMRTFSVPHLGPVVMDEHVRIGSGRPPSPRLHVLDDTRGQSGKVFVGYIGPHLPNGRDPK